MTLDGEISRNCDSTDVIYFEYFLIIFSAWAAPGRDLSKRVSHCLLSLHTYLMHSLHLIVRMPESIIILNKY
jgi:hypothetical protein